jgi:hypothetical protein
MSVEERLRAAARARTDVVTSVRPLELPAESPARVRRRRHARRWLGWGAPIAAAALVTAVALALVLLRQAGGAQSRPSAPASGSTAAASIPRYYVELAYTGSTSDQMKAIVGDDRTGRKLAVLNPTASQNFYGVTAAADDRTFVVMNYDNPNPQTTWYLLRIAPPHRASRPADEAANQAGPGARQRPRAVPRRPRARRHVPHRHHRDQCQDLPDGLLDVVRSRAEHLAHDWPQNDVIGADGNGVGLTWVNGDRTVDFLWSVPARETAPGKFVPGKKTLRALDVTAGGHDLMADSLQVMQFPAWMRNKQARTWTEPCANVLPARDGTVVCGSAGGSDVSGVAAKVPQSYAGYSAATGKPLHVIYRFDGPVLNANYQVLWTDPSGSHAIAHLLIARKGVKVPGGDKFGIAF